MVIVQCKEYFQKMLSSIKEWADRKRQKIDEHNVQLDAIKRIVLMTVEEKIAQQT